jgi:hypothetical protein
MDGFQQYPDAASRIMALVKSTFGKTFTSYFLGLPNDFIIPEDAYPACIVQKAGGEYKVGPTTADDITESVYVHFLVNSKIGFGTPDNDDTVMRQLQTLVEGRDPTTGYLLPNTLMYALRTFITLRSDSVPGLVTINNDVHITYDAAKRTNQLFTREAVIDISVTERQVFLGRS